MICFGRCVTCGSCSVGDSQFGNVVVKLYAATLIRRLSVYRLAPTLLFCLFTYLLTYLRNQPPPSRKPLNVASHSVYLNNYDGANFEQCVLANNDYLPRSYIYIPRLCEPQPHSTGYWLTRVLRTPVYTQPSTFWTIHTFPFCTGEICTP